MTNERHRHEWDDDACCIHCGFDGAEEWHDRCFGREPAEREPTPDYAIYCPVRHPSIRTTRGTT